MWLAHAIKQPFLVCSKASQGDKSRFAPLRVTFTHAGNADLRKVHRLLPVDFAQTVDGWVLPQRGKYGEPREQIGLRRLGFGIACSPAKKNKKL